MAITFKTATPSALLSAIKEEITNGKIITWSCDKDGDFTHNLDQWRNKAWLRPSFGTSELNFGLLGQKETVMTKEIYAVYHGRFIEMVLTHFDTKILQGIATAQKSAGDNFKAS
jgi:hypothetical protein